MSTNEQLAWDFDDGDVAEVRPDTGIARFAPGSEQWIAALQPTDDDAIRLDRFDENTMTAEAAARLWARVAAWVESDQIAYYIDDSPVSSDAAYDARMRCLERLEAAFPSLDNPQSPTHRVGGSFSNDFASVRHPSRMMSLDDVFSIEELKDWYDSVIRDLDWPESKPLPMSCEVKIDGLFVAYGVASSAALAQKAGAVTIGGKIRVNDSMMTNVNGLFAAGDCTGGLLQVSKAVGDGAAAGMAIIKYVKREK